MPVPPRSPSTPLEGVALRATDPLASGTLARTLFEQSPFSSVLYDAEGHPLALNAAFTAMWGVGIDSVPPGYSVLEDPELERQGALPLIRRAFDGEAVKTPALRYDIARVSSTGRGKVLWTEGHFFPVRDADGGVSHVVLVHTDITDRVEHEEAIRRSEERLRLAQRAARIGVFDWDVPTGRVAWTEDEEQLFGLEPGTFDGTIDGWARTVMPDDLVAMQRQMADAMARRERELSFAFRIRWPNGEIRHIEGRAAFLYREDGTALRMVGVNVDVTERVRLFEAERLARAEAERARVALEERQRELRETQAIARLGSWRWETATNTLVWDDGTCALYGVSRERAPADFASYLALVHPDDRELAARIAQDALHDGDEFAFDHRVLLPDGGIRHLHGRGRVVRGADGRPLRMLGSSQDVTDRKNAEAELARLLESERVARADAELANRAKSDFLAKMSHELRTPLNAIAGYAELLEIGVHGPLGAEQRDAVSRVRHNQRHLLALINDILDFSSIERGALRLASEDVPVASVLASLDSLIGPQFRARDVRFVVELPPAALAARGDRERIVQVCLNLLSNALKATPSGGEVAVSADGTATAVRIRVRDTGVGIPEDGLEAIFSPFTQLGRTFSRPGSGVGLGLAISRELARAMGGDLDVRSTLGAGSTFTLSLERVHGS